MVQAGYKRHVGQDPLKDEAATIVMLIVLHVRVVYRRAWHWYLREPVTVSNKRCLRRIRAHHGASRCIIIPVDHFNIVAHGRIIGASRRINGSVVGRIKAHHRRIMMHHHSCSSF